jgi:tetratricopeptide (TPR) repeat protein
MKIHLLLLALIFPLLVTACRFGEKGTDAEDATNPYFAQAEKFESEENYNAAIDQYEKALQANPAVVKAYEKMGDLYSEKLGDPVSAIYCYQKYLRARPNIDNKELVSNNLEKARHDFALTLPPNATAGEVGAQPGVTGPAAAPAPGGMNMTVTVPAAGPAAAPAPVSTPAPAPAAAPAAGHGARTYVIQKGDNLWKIAHQFYPGDVKGGVEKIKQANPEAAANDRGLKLGATLIIP